jgi:hypothetical protein
MILLTPKIRARTYVSQLSTTPNRDYLFEIEKDGFCVVVHYDGRKTRRACSHSYLSYMPVGFVPTKTIPKECVSRATMALMDVWK